MAQANNFILPQAMVKGICKILVSSAMCHTNLFFHRLYENIHKAPRWGSITKLVWNTVACTFPTKWEVRQEGHMSFGVKIPD